jgi:hypothetical protein
MVNRIRTNNDLQSTTQTTKDWTTQPYKILGVNSGTVSLALRVTLVQNPVISHQ